MLLSFTITATATNFYGGNRNRKAVCKASYEIDANDNLLRDRKKREKHKKNKEYTLFTTLEKNKKNKKYTYFDPSDYQSWSSLGLVDMSNASYSRKWFSMVPDFPEKDSIYKPFLKKDCYKSMIAFGKVLDNAKMNLAQCLGLDFKKLGFLEPPQPKLVVIKSLEEYKKNRDKKRKKRNPLQRSCHRRRVHAEGRAIDLQISWVTDDNIWREIIENEKKEALFSQLESYAKARFDFVKIQRGSKKPLLHVSCDDTD